MATIGEPSTLLLHVSLLALLLFVPVAGSNVAGEPCVAVLSASPPLCPVSCFISDPVCGADGVTYWCGCPEAACSGVRVSHLGFCEVRSGSAGLAVPMQAFLLVHIVWLFLLGFLVLFDFI